MSGYIKRITDPFEKAYLNKIRQSNQKRMSICHYCGNKSIGITCEGYLIYPACSEHSKK